MYEVKLMATGPFRLSEELIGTSTQALKADTPRGEIYTTFTIDGSRRTDGYAKLSCSVNSQLYASALRIGIVYIGEVCDLLSMKLRIPIELHIVPTDNPERNLQPRVFEPLALRVIEREDRDFALGQVAGLRQQHPRLLSASSWYRKGQNSEDVTDKLCCYWRALERVAFSYAIKDNLAADDKSRAIPVISAFAAQFFQANETPELFTNLKTLKDVYEIRNDISHANVPLNLELIEKCHDQVDMAEEAAHRVISAAMKKVLTLA